MKLKKREHRRNSLKDLDELSDGENPIPRNLRHKMSNKRKIVVSSDSEDDEMPVKSTKQKKLKITENSAKKRKDSDIEISSDEDELVRGTASSSEKKTNKRKSKNELPAGQKTLNFFAKTSKEDEKPKAKTVSHVNPADFFKPIKTTKKEAPKPTKTISPSQKENSTVIKKKTPSPVKKPDIDDEFVDSDDSFESFVPTKIKTPEKKKEIKKNSPSPSPPPPPKKVQAAPKKVPKTVSKDSGFSEEPVKVKKVEVNDPNLPWVDKYKPQSFNQLVGQHGDKSPINKLLDWLKDWAKHNLGEGAKIKKPKPAPWMNGQDGTPFKAALLSGSPGIGKTTCAYMACNMLNFKFVEMNASDVRNKKHLEAKIGELSGSHQIEQFFGVKKSVAQDNLKVHHVLIMDEVDGMSGNEDRAGISELIQIIKESKIPIICICNDRQHTKIRSLANHCFDIKFPKPRVEQIRSRMMTICCTEKMKITKEELDEVIELSNHDVRQTIYNLQMRSNSKDAKVNQKDISVGPFEAARKLLDSRSTLQEKQEMFFVDYGIMPLFVQDNYLSMKNDKHTPLEAIRGLRKASRLISLGDNVDRIIRSGGSWKLLNEQSMLSAALPAIATGGHMKARIEFPSWLGKNSTAGKRKRLLQQLVSHTHLKVSASMYSFATEYAPMLRTKITKPLLEKESDGIAEVVDTMIEYDLIRDDSEALSEIVVWPGKIDPASKILTKVKSALTRTLNKSSRMLPYSLDDVAKGKKRTGVNSIGVEMDEEGNLVEKFEDDDGASDDEEGGNGESSEVVVKITKAGKAAPTKSTRGGRGGTRGGATRGRGAKK
ncbi:unnamed protein product [Caenorhabditis angaria]|uniref:AAA+ ATPase domain-containing protein n=1 Tax=Caenorhabditis angaria TaxID=860376 RepID=A0A9P1IUV2_9PELO|nr:unnamed protein product [Caenorhabditis angaria]